jgi:RHS repeat-associated protein
MKLPAGSPSSPSDWANVITQTPLLELLLERDGGGQGIVCLWSSLTAYDANGNMTARASSAQNITWSSYNYPTAIAASDATGNEGVQLFYGPDRQRWKQIYTNSTTTEQTYYIGGLVDLVFSGGTTNYRHYIYAGNEPVAVYSRTAAGVNTMSYMLEDHQGSVSAIASSAGTADVNESFSAFGTRRNPTTWSGSPTTTDLNTIASLSRQGYTFQTALGQSMGLNHMNGRVQDAILGRFLSPDPHIPDPSNAQSYNRYSYVNNNPLTLVDPSGFTDEHHPICVGCDPTIVIGDADDDLFGSNDTSGLTAWFNAVDNVITGALKGTGAGIVPSTAPNFAADFDSSSTAQSQDSASIPQASAPADYQIDTPITVSGTGVPGDSGASNDLDSADQFGEIIVVGNQGERGWQGNNPDPTKGVQPIRDSNGKIVDWSVRNPQTGKRTGKSLEWGRQNGLDPNNFFHQTARSQRYHQHLAYQV